MHLGDQLEGFHVAGADDAEVSAIQLGDGGDGESFGRGDGRGVHEIEAEVCVLLDQLQTTLSYMECMVGPLI